MAAVFASKQLMYEKGKNDTHYLENEIRDKIIESRSEDIHLEAVMNGNGELYINHPDDLSYYYIDDNERKMFPWSKEKHKIKTIIFDEDITSIICPEEEEAPFSDCVNLEKIVFKSKSISIKGEVFDNCESIKEIMYPEGAQFDLPDKNTFKDTQYVKSSKNDYVLLGNVLLRYKGNQKKIKDIPENVTQIADGAFDNCKKVTSIRIPSNIETLYDGVLRGCSNLEEITVDEGNMHYASADGILYDSKKTTLVFCPRTRRGRVDIPKGVKSIEETAFADCKYVTEVLLPKGLETMGESVFENCAGLEEINIPEGVMEIGDECFNGCSNLKRITLPASLETISGWMLCGAPGLNEIVVDPANENYLVENGILYDNDKTAILFCSKNKKGSVHLPDTVELIDDKAFSSCSEITEVFIGTGTSEILEESFSDCSKLKKIVIKGQLESIGENAFANCPLLSEIYYSGSEESWEDALEEGMERVGLRKDKTRVIWQ